MDYEEKDAIYRIVSEMEKLNKNFEKFFLVLEKLVGMVIEKEFPEKKIEKSPEPKKEVKTIAYKNTEVEESIEVNDPSGIVYGSVKNETEKALLIVDANGNREAWIPKKCIKSGDVKSTKFVIHDWFIEKIGWSVV